MNDLNKDPSGHDEPRSADGGAEVNGAPVPDLELRKSYRIAVIKYGLARLAMVLVLTVVIQLLVVVIGAPVPLLFSALLALFVSLPLSMLVFTKWRVEATETLAEYARQRKEHKAWLERELAGR